MAHFAEVDENNVVLRVLATDNDDPDGEEGYQWLVENLGGTWLKTSFNTRFGKHLLGGTPFRGHYATPGGLYLPELDIFQPIRPTELSWIFNPETVMWHAPTPKPDDVFNEYYYTWDEPSLSWVKIDVPEDEKIV